MSRAMVRVAGGIRSGLAAASDRGGRGVRSGWPRCPIGVAAAEGGDRDGGAASRSCRGAGYRRPVRRDPPRRSAPLRWPGHRWITRGSSGRGCRPGVPHRDRDHAKRRCHGPRSRRGSGWRCRRSTGPARPRAKRPPAGSGREVGPARRTPRSKRRPGPSEEAARPVGRARLGRLGERGSAGWESAARPVRGGGPVGRNRRRASVETAHRPPFRRRAVRPGAWVPVCSQAGSQPWPRPGRRPAALSAHPDTTAAHEPAAAETTSALPLAAWPRPRLLKRGNTP